MTAHRRLRRSLVLWALAIPSTLTIGGCAVDEVMEPPSCEGGGSIVIVAQSVPEAHLVPCLDRLPDGWTVSSVTIDDTGTVIRFDSDRAGDDAAVLRYGSTCDVTGASSVVSDLAFSRRFDEIQQVEPGFRAVRTYTFLRGCITWTFDFDDDASATESVAIGNALSVVTRPELNEHLSESFLDEEL